MNHWIIAPIVLPAITAVALLLGARLPLRVGRTLSVTATVTLAAIAVLLLLESTGGRTQVYALGNWPPPFGIVLVLDRLSALMVVLTAALGLFTVFYAVQGWDSVGANFHALFQFQLMGLCGAFLTGDLFNLFVFFEILLIASYGLLLHGGGPGRVKAGVHYAIYNLATSSLFLLAVGLIYGVTGTLNMADLAVRIAEAGPDQAALLNAGALLLLVVFAAKSALLPLYFWLPEAYSAAAAPVAALFAIMTKVGIYAILRVFTLIFGPGAGVAAAAAEPWLLPLALLTLALGTIGALAARRLRLLVAYLVIASVGTMLIGAGLFDRPGITAAIYYTAHSTIILGALFLLADLVSVQRGEADDRLQPAAPVAQPALLGGFFLVGAIAVVGMPPLSGFVGKVLILESALPAPGAPWIYAVVLVTSLLGIVALSRAGTRIFWNTRPGAAGTAARPAAVMPCAVLLALTLALAFFAGPVTEFSADTAAQLLEREAYIQGVLGPDATAGTAGVWEGAR